MFIDKQNNNTLKTGHNITTFDTWSLTFREEHKLRVFKNGVLRLVFGPDREEEAKGRSENCITRNFKICTPHQILFRRSK
jgi:hypothetical protein